MTSPEELLVASLHHRADRVEAEPTPVSSVAERAGAQQRRARTVTGLAAAVAVAAVVVPLVVVLGDGSDRGDGPLPADRPTVAPSDAGWLGTLPAGPAPAVPWLDRDLVRHGRRHPHRARRRRRPRRRALPRRLRRDRARRG